MVKKANICKQILGKPEQQSIVDHSTSKLVPHPQLLFALGLPTILNWLPINSVAPSVDASNANVKITLSEINSAAS
jgi:hypothetical protein